MSMNYIRITHLLPSATYGIKIVPVYEPLHLVADVPPELWRNQTLHLVHTPSMGNGSRGGESISRNVVTVPVNFSTHEKTQDKSMWTVLAICLGTAVLMGVLGFILYRRWHQRRMKSVPDTSPSQRYRHYSHYGPGQSLRTDHSPAEPSRIVDKWELPVSSVKTGPMLGSGAFGKVVKGRVSRAVLESRELVTSLTQTGQLCLDQADKYHVTVAIKMLHDYCDCQHKRDFLKEIDLMKRIGHHQNVVSMLGCCTTRDPVCLVVEHMSNGDLLEYLKDMRQRLVTIGPVPGHYTNAKQGRQIGLGLLNFARQIALGMEFLAAKGYVHRDLAARNVLVDSSSQCKIGDFGLTRYMYDDQVYVNRKGGRLPVKWMSIEAIFDQSFSTASDVWSFGVVLYEIVTLGGSPYPTIPSRDLLKELQSGYRMERPDNCSEEVYEMMIQCWKQDCKLRPSFGALSDWLEGMLNDRSGLDYINMGINLNRDAYQMNDEPDVDCIRYPLHRTRPSRAILGGDRLVTTFEATSDDSGYTASKKSSVSSGETGTIMPSMNGRDESEQAEMSERASENNTSRAQLTTGNERSVMETNDDQLSNTKPKTVRKRVSFIDNDAFVEDDVFQDDVAVSLKSMYCRKHYGAKMYNRNGETTSTDCSSRKSNGDIEPVSKLKRRFSDSILLDICSKNNTSRLTLDSRFYDGKQCRKRIFKTCSDSEYGACENDDINTEPTLDIQYSRNDEPNSRAKARKRKNAVVTAPMLALDNDLYFHLDTARFKQNPPPIKSRRKIKSLLLKDDENFPDVSVSLNDSKTGNNLARNKKKFYSFEYSVEAEIHNPATTHSSIVVPWNRFAPSNYDTKQIQESARGKNEVVHDELSCSKMDVGNTTDGESVKSDTVFYDLVSNLDKKNCFENSFDPNVPVLPRVEHEEEEAVGAVSGNGDNDGQQHATGVVFLGSQGRVRNDSGIPRSPDDVNSSPGSGTGFFSSGSDIDIICSSTHKTTNVSDLLFSRCDSPAFRFPEALYTLDRTGSLKANRQSNSQERSAGIDCPKNDRSCNNCPALASEKHPHGLYHTRKRAE